MKKTFILFVLSLNLFSCSSNEDNAETVQTSKALAYFKASFNDKPFEYIQDDSNSPTHQYAYLNGSVTTGTSFEKAYYTGCALYPYSSQTGYPQIALSFNGLYTTTLSGAFYNSFKTTPTNFITLNEANSGKKGIDITYQLANGTIYSTHYGSQSGSALTVTSSISGVEQGSNLKIQTLVGTVTCKLYHETNASDVIQVKKWSI
jgi:hypothetical protein